MVHYNMGEFQGEQQVQEEFNCGIVSEKGKCHGIKSLTDGSNTLKRSSTSQELQGTLQDI